MMSHLGYQTTLVILSSVNRRSLIRWPQGWQMRKILYPGIKVYLRRSDSSYLISHKLSLVQPVQIYSSIRSMSVASTTVNL